MRIIPYPWIAIHLDTDRIRIAYPVSENAGNDFTIKALDEPGHRFDPVFHYSASGEQWQFGTEAWKRLESDPDGIVTIPVNLLQWERPMVTGDGASASPAELISLLLRQIKNHCEVALFDGMPVRGCVISVQHRYNTIRTILHRLAGKAGFERVLFRDAMVAGAMLWKSDWQLESHFILLCNIGDQQVTIAVLQKDFQGFVKTGIRSKTVHFGADRISAHLLSQLCGASPSWSDLTTGEKLSLRKLRLERMFGEEQKRTSIRLGGEERPVEPSHWNKAFESFLSELQVQLAPYLEDIFKTLPVPSTEVPFIVLGMGRYDVNLENAMHSHLRSGCFYWPQSDDAIPMGLALMLRPGLEALPPDADGLARTHRQRFLAATESNDFRAQYKLGRDLEDGRHTCRIEEEAVDWYRLSASQGYPKAKFRLAYMIARDKGADYDPRELKILIEDLEGMGFRMDLFRQGSDRFQEARRIEIENQRTRSPNRHEEIQRLKNEAEALFSDCRKRNHSFSSSFVRRIAAPSSDSHAKQQSSGGPSPTASLSPILSAPPLPVSWLDSFLGFLGVTLVLLVGGFFLLQDADANSIARYGASVCFCSGLVSSMVALILMFRFLRDRKKTGT